MKIIVGLGNPGKKYTLTRHNVGFFVLDILRNELEENKELSGGVEGDLDFKDSKKFDSEIAKFKLDGEELWLVRPQTYMNKSGVAVNKIINFSKANSSDLVVLHDDMDIAVGKLKIKDSGSSAGHNGVQSIIDNLGTDKFLRVRVGVGRPSDGQDPSDYVLGKITKEDREVIEVTTRKFISNSIKYLSVFLNN